MRSGGGHQADRGALVPFLVPWVGAGLLDAYLALGSWPRPTAAQFALELIFLAAAGRSQWRLARGWFRSTLVPAGVLLVFAMLLYAPEPYYQLVPFTLGLVGGVFWLIRAIESRWRVPVVVGTVAAFAAVLGARWIDVALLGRPDGSEAPSVLRDAMWPFTRPAPPASIVDAPPMVVVSIDTLRADAAEGMASFQRLAARGALWRRAMSTSSWTMPALGTLQTGLMPSAHGATCLEDGHCQGLSPDVPTLAEELAAAGWVTAAVVSNPWVGTGTAFNRGFATFLDSGHAMSRLLVAGPPWGPHRQDDMRAVDAALGWLEHAPARGFYLWVHLMGEHMPYEHSSLPDMQALDPVRLRSGYPPSDAEKKRVRDAYQGEVAYTDRQVMRLLDALDARGILDHGVVVLTADHGEELWDHGGIEHGHSHHGEVVDVALALVAPGVAPGERSGVASLLDVAPTLRAIAGLPPHGLDLRAGVPAGRVATAWGGLILHLDCSARDEQRRVIARDCSHDPYQVHVYDLVHDPRELTPIPWTPDDPLVQAAWRLGPPPRRAAATLPVERLRALGYMQ
jgi:hypothetical protein